MSKFRQALIDKMGVPVEQCEVSTKFGQTSYLAAGYGNPVVLIHGAGAGAVTWYPCIAALSDRYRVIAPDVVGYGESEKPDAQYDRAFFSAWLLDYFKALDIEKAHVVGLSQGGAIALQFALDNADLVEKLVLVDSGGLGAKPSFGPMFSMILMNVFPSNLANRFNSRYLLFDPTKRDPNHGFYSIEVLKKLGGKNAFTKGKGAAVSAMSKEDLARIQNQTLIVWGENDRLFSVEQVADASAAIPNATFRKIGQAGHLPLMDQSEKFNEMLVSFLNAPQSEDA
jgi:4,5:9,10-diseco-3-hydroxy-5,9,17-trioxoandrosta-1(10),2-diene-4-oate hydrolase